MTADVCLACHGTGETGRYGILDCAAPGCTAAAERAALSAALHALGAVGHYDLVWAAYQLGKAAGKSKIEK